MLILLNTNIININTRVYTYPIIETWHDQLKFTINNKYLYLICDFLLFFGAHTRNTLLSAAMHVLIRRGDKRNIEDQNKRVKVEYWYNYVELDRWVLSMVILAVRSEMHILTDKQRQAAAGSMLI